MISMFLFIVLYLVAPLEIAHAQDLEPRAYTNAPIGLNLERVVNVDRQSESHTEAPASIQRPAVNTIWWVSPGNCAGAAMRFARMERRKKFHPLATFSSARRQ